MIFFFMEAEKDEKDRRWCVIQQKRGGGEGGRRGQKFDEAKNKKIHIKERYVDKKDAKEIKNANDEDKKLVIFVLLEAQKEKDGRKRWCDIQKGKEG